MPKNCVLISSAPATIPTTARPIAFRPLAEAAGVGDLVSETPQRIPYLDALEVLANSNVILLLGSDEPHYTASKIYPGTDVGTAVPVVIPQREQRASHSRRRPAAALRCRLQRRRNLTHLRLGLRRRSGSLATAPDAVGKPRLETIAPYSARAVAGRFAEIFDAVAR